MKSSRISRVVRILTALQSGRDYTADDLAKMFGISRRTIFRDLKELQAIGVPYRYDSKTGGYSIDPEYFLPPIDLSLQEALSLLLVVHKASSHMQVPFRNSALLAALKIENNLPVKIRNYCNTTLQNISTRMSAQAPLKLLDKIFGELQRAIFKKHKVCIQYGSLYEGEVIEVELDPYHLMYARRAWYVMGFSGMHKSIRTFKLNRIKELKTLDKCFVNEKGFDLYEYFGKAWSMIPEGRIYNVSLRFLPRVAHNVSEVQWHSTQEIQYNKDGSVTIDFRVDGLGEISWWVLGYGDQVQVLGPKALRKTVSKMAENIIKLNKGLV